MTTKLKNYIIKFIFEKYYDTLQNNFLMHRILSENKKIFDSENLLCELEMKIHLIEIIEKQKIKINLMDLIESDLMIKNNK